MDEHGAAARGGLKALDEVRAINGVNITHMSPEVHQEGVQEKRDLITKLRTAGYAASSVDSLKADTTRMILYIYVGQKVDNIILRN